MSMSSLTGLKLDNGEFPSYAWPGGYPIYYLDGCNNVLCPACVNRQQKQYELDILADLCNWAIDPEDSGTHFDARDLPVAADCNWEDDSLYCDDCGERIESAYGPTDDDENE